ncbi:MAG: hypothetical protein ABSH01_13720 [Terriglobia bacterium]
MIRAEVAVLPENDNNALAVQVRQARGQLGEKFRAQAEQLQKLDQDLKELRDEHEQLESEVWHQFEALEKLVAEFAGAQLDRLMALSGRATTTVSQDANGGVEPESAPGLASPAGAAEPPAEVAELSEASASGGETSASSIDEPLPPPPASPLMEAGAPVGPAPAEAQAELPAARATIGFVPAPGPVPVPVMEAQRAVGVAPAPAPGAGFDVSQLSEAEQKTHKDARRFARLLVFEIELYNKAKVAEGRKSKDLYRRMKLDIDRSRQTFEQRYGKTVGKQFDYFHDELVRILAGNDPSLLGSGYPGPSV